jgi:hypothetical protein
MKNLITPQGWLKLADKKNVQKRIGKDPILPLYDIIVKQFANWHFVEWQHAVIALHIVYGWMPRMPDFALPEKLTVDQQKRKKVVEFLNKAKSGTLGVNEIEYLKTNLINNSIIGTSKVLHLLAPEKYAIWDKHVATAWFRHKHSYSYYNSSEKYLAYIDTLKKWLTEKQISSQQFSSVRELSQHLGKVSQLRLLELVLFHEKPHKKN